MNHPFVRTSALFALGAFFSLSAAANLPIEEDNPAPIRPEGGFSDFGVIMHRAALKAYLTRPTEWTRWGSTWVRRESDGNLSCLSYNGMDCEWNSETLDPKTVPASKIKPLVCGIAHQRVWSTSGYNDEQSGSASDRHWCRSAYGTLFAKWQDHSVLGAPYMLAETPQGDLMCHSTDGKNCTSVEEFPKISRDDEVHPLVCGAHHRKVNQHDGYGQEGHWCQTPKLLMTMTDVAVESEPTKTQLVTVPPWMAKDEPAMVVRTKIPEGQTLVLGAFTAFSRELGEFKDKVGPAGFSAGKYNKFHAAGVYQDAPWKAPVTTGPLTMAFKVTDKGHMCYFAADAASKRDGTFIGNGALLGDSIQITNSNHVAPIGFLSSHSVKVNLGTHKVRMPAVYGLSDKSAPSSSFKIDELFLVAARSVPIEGDLTGAKRKISYAANCVKTAPAY